MFKIAHRGNLLTQNKAKENSPEVVDKAISKFYDVEIDLWLSISSSLYLGHDAPIYPITENWLLSRKNKIWIHCKNYEALLFLKKKKSRVNYFWHQNDEYTITSLGYVWAYPRRGIIAGAINVLPEKLNPNWHLMPLSEALGFCSDEIIKI